MNCGKCHGSFEKDGRDPLLLPTCGHTLCRSCLRLFTQHNGFKCPFCGVKQPSKVNLSDLLPNYALLRVIEAQSEDNGRGSKKRDRHRSAGRRGAEDKDVDRDRSTHTSKENECVEHMGVRLTYWCGPCGVAACGECVVEKHCGGGGGGGGRRHQAVRIDAALKMKRSELESLVFEVMRSMDAAEEKRANVAKSSPFVAAAKKLQTEVSAVVGKMRVVMSFLACLIQEGEDGDAGLRQLRLEIDELIQKTPPSGSATGNFMEIRALLHHLKCIEEFRDGPVAKVLKEVEALGREDCLASLSSAFVHTTALNLKAAALCKQVASCGNGSHLEVVGGAGLVGNLTWEQNRLHLQCLRHPSPTEPRRPSSDPARRHNIKWAVVQSQMQEVTQVFVVLAWGGQGQGGAGKERVYFKLCCPDSTFCRCFLQLAMGVEDFDGSNNSLLGPLAGAVQEVAGARVILLGTHCQKKGKDAGKKSKEGGAEDTTDKTDSNSSASSPVTFAAGDVICAKGRQCEGETEFWLVTEGTTRIVKPLATCEVVGQLLPAHKSLLPKLPILRAMKVEDCGVVLSTEKESRESARASTASPSARVSPSVHSRNGGEGTLTSQKLV